MSYVTVAEIHTLVCKVYRISPVEMRQRVRGRSRSEWRSMGHEARAAFALLVGRHTEAPMSEIISMMGWEKDGDALRSLSVEVARFLGLMGRDPWREALVERIERGIDRIHEARTAEREHSEPGVMPPRKRRERLRPHPPIGQDKLPKLEWWASNDAVFRRAYLDAAE